MKQYKRVIGNNGNGPEPMDGPIIVLTIEELRDMWDTAQGWGTEIKTLWDESHTFESFLQSKGIKLDSNG